MCIKRFKGRLLGRPKGRPTPIPCPPAPPPVWRKGRPRVPVRQRSQLLKDPTIKSRDY